MRDSRKTALTICQVYLYRLRVGEDSTFPREDGRSSRDRDDSKARVRWKSREFTWI